MLQGELKRYSVLLLIYLGFSSALLLYSVCRKKEKRKKRQKKKERDKLFIAYLETCSFACFLRSEKAVGVWHETEEYNPREEIIEDKSKERQNKLKTDKQLGEILENKL